MSSKLAIVYMVAGMSSRFGGKIKQFARVGPNDETLIELSINQAVKAGFNEIVFIVGSKTEVPFYEKFGDSYKGVPVKYAMQSFDPEIRDKPWGTTDALCSALDVIDSPFVVCNGDDLYGEEAFSQIAKAFESKSESVTLGYKLGATLPEEGSVNRGIFDLDSDGYVKDIVETFDIIKGQLSDRNLSDESPCSMNIFGLLPEVLEMLAIRLKEFRLLHEGDRAAECLLPVELGKLIDEGKIKMRLYETDSLWLGVTNPEDEEVVRGIICKDEV